MLNFAANFLLFAFLKPFVIKNVEYPLQWFCGQNPLMGVLETFPTGTYAIIGTTCVEFENVMKSTTKKKKNPLITVIQTSVNKCSVLFAHIK